jgi:NADP-dependent 3-hydroxy acid dehydrogenase YdfG
MKLVICSHKANVKYAEELNKKLFPFGIYGKIALYSDQSRIPTISLLEEFSGPIILLFSDNYFKSDATMTECIKIIHDYMDKEKIYPVIVPSVDSLNNEIDTQYDKVKNVIQLMNYWQEKYLSHRKEARDKGENAEVNNKLLRTRKISSEVGEFLRIIKDKNIPNYHTLEGQNFGSLIRWIQGFPNDFTEDPKFSLENEKIFQESEEKIGIETGTFPTFESEKDGIKGYQENIEIIESSERDSEVVLDGLSTSLIEEEDTTTEKEIKILTSNDMKQTQTIQVGEIDIQPIQSTETEGTLLEPKENLEFPKAEEEEEDTEDFDLDEDDDYDDDDFDDDDFDDDDEDWDEEDDWEDLEEDSNDAEDQANDLTVGNIVSGNTLEPFQGSKVNLTADEEIVLLLEEKKNIDLVVQQAIVLAKKGESNQGVAILEQAIEKFPDNNPLRFQFASFLVKYTGNFTKAKAQLAFILESDDNHLNSLFLLGEIAEKEGEYLESRKYYEKVLSLDVNYPDIQFRLAALLFEKFETQEKLAAKLLKKALERDQDHEEAHYLLGIILNEYLHSHKSALFHLLKVIEINTTHPFAYYDLATIYFDTNQKEKAKEFYLNACSINPELNTLENDLVFLGTIRSSESNSLVRSKQVKVELPKDDLKKKRTKVAAESHKENPEIKTILITGATSGIGKATAEIFAKNGHRVILTGRRSEILKDLKTKFSKEYNNEPLLLPFDIRTFSANKSAIESLEGPWKNIDVLINNAGLAKGLSSIHEGKIEDWEIMIDTNLKGLLYITRLVAPEMVKNQKGHIINIGSIAGKEVYPNGNVYCATKFAVDAITKAMRLDLAPHNIRVSSISPGHVEETEFALNRFDGNVELANIYKDFTPLNSNDIAENIYYIFSQPEHITIHDMVITGTQQASATQITRSGRKKN